MTAAVQEMKALSQKGKTVENGLSAKRVAVDALVERVKNLSDQEDAKAALFELKQELQNASASVVTVPPILKFLRTHFDELEVVYSTVLSADEMKKAFADILSVIYSTYPDPERKVLKYRLEGTQENLDSWGYEYLTRLTGQVIAEFSRRNEAVMADESADTQLEKADCSDLLAIAFQIVEFNMQHHNEIDAVDILVELQQIEQIPKYVSPEAYRKVCQYLLSLGIYIRPNSESLNLYKVAYDIYMREKQFPDAARVALKIHDDARLLKAFKECEGDVVRLQVCYLLAAQSYRIPDETLEEWNLSEEEMKAIGNQNISELFAILAKDLDVLEPKLPEDVYRASLGDNADQVLENSNENLATTFVNAFVNAAFSNDGLLTAKDSTWLYRNKSQELTVATASLGVIYLWNVDIGLSQIDKYQWASDPLIRAGAYMAFGLVLSSLKSEMELAHGLLYDRIESSYMSEQIGAILGLGFAYAGVPREFLLESLVPLIIDTSVVIEMSAFAALTVGLSFMGTRNPSAVEAILQTLLERQAYPGMLDSQIACLFPLALAILFYGAESEVDPTLEAVEAIGNTPLGKLAHVCIYAMAYAGTGNITHIEHLLEISMSDSSAPVSMSETKFSLTEKSEEKTSFEEASANSNTAEATADKTGKADDGTAEKSKANQDIHRSAAVIAMVAIALGEEVGTEMVSRLLEHVIHYGEPAVCKSVPYAFSLLYASNPKPAVVEKVSRLLYDTDGTINLGSFIALGVIGAGTNNSRIADSFRFMFRFKDHYVLRLAQALLYMGKGLMTLSPIHSDRFLLNPVSFCTLYVILNSIILLGEHFFTTYSYLFYLFVPAMRPHMLMTIDKEKKQVPVVVRVGEAVDTTAQAGNPRSITGFQTHTTPVLLSEGERAEMGTLEYEPVTRLPLEGIVILKPSENAEDKATDISSKA